MRSVWVRVPNSLKLEISLKTVAFIINEFYSISTESHTYRTGESSLTANVLQNLIQLHGAVE